MFASGYDSEALTLVVIHGGASSQDIDFELAVKAIDVLADDTCAAGGVARLMMVVEVDDRPDARWRRRLAEAEKRIPAMYFSFVSSSAIARGVVTAIHWLSPNRPGVVRATHASIAESLRWFEQNGEGSAARLQPLLAHARDALAQAALKTG